MKKIINYFGKFHASYYMRKIDDSGILIADEGTTSVNSWRPHPTGRLLGIIMYLYYNIPLTFKYPNENSKN